MAVFAKESIVKNCCEVNHELNLRQNNEKFLYKTIALGPDSLVLISRV